MMGSRTPYLPLDEGGLGKAAGGGELMQPPAPALRVDPPQVGGR